MRGQRAKPLDPRWEHRYRAQTACTPLHLQACGLPANHARIGGDRFADTTGDDPVTRAALLAHTERACVYRPPHDHGRGWVIYAVQRDEMEMSTYRRVHDLRGNAHIVWRESFVLCTGDIRVFLLGDIYDSRWTPGPLTQFRFTSRDFKKEEVTRYPEPRSAACIAPSLRVS